MEWKQDNYLISDDDAILDIDAICDFLSKSYWANKRPPDVIENSLQHSLNFGVYDLQNKRRQVGFARVVTDYSTFAYLCDVVIQENYRGRALGKWMMECIMSHSELQNLKRWCLLTKDAHGLYKQFGFRELDEPSRWMEIFNPNV